MPTPPKKRVMWVDIAKGISIITVVLLHLATFGTTIGVSPGFWYNISRAFEHVRLPLFFMVSGLFAAKIRTFTFAELFCKRTWLWGVPFVLWGAIVLVARRIILHDNSDNFWHEWVRGFLFPDNGIWFLMALLVFTLVIWVFRNVRGRYVTGVAVILTLMMPFLDSAHPGDLMWSWRRLAMYFSSYCIGLYGRQMILAIVQHLRWYFAVVLFVVLAVAEHFYPRLSPGVALSLANIALILLGLLTGVAISVALDGSFLGRGLAYVGRHTLEIYLMNEILTWIFFLSIFPRLRFNYHSDSTTWPMEWVVTKPAFVWGSSNFWAVILGTLFVCLASLFIREVVKGSRLDWVFTPPSPRWMEKWMATSVERRAKREERKEKENLSDSSTHS